MKLVLINNRKNGAPRSLANVPKLAEISVQIFYDKRVKSYFPNVVMDNTVLFISLKVEYQQKKIRRPRVTRE